MPPETDNQTSCGGYSAGHPWYYVLGGKVLPPRAIMAEVQRRGYRGYLADHIDKADTLPEPRRSQALRALKTKVLGHYRDDLSRYRQLAVQLHRQRRRESPEDAPRCEDIHTSLSLKHNHLYNDLAHILTLDRLLTRQRDLFDL